MCACDVPDRPPTLSPSLTPTTIFCNILNFATLSAAVASDRQNQPRPSMSALFACPFTLSLTV